MRIRQAVIIRAWPSKKLRQVKLFDRISAFLALQQVSMDVKGLME